MECQPPVLHEVVVGRVEQLMQNGLALSLGDAHDFFHARYIDHPITGCHVAVLCGNQEVAVEQLDPGWLP